MNIIRAFLISVFLCNEFFISTSIFSGTLAVKGEYPFAVRIFYYFVEDQSKATTGQLFYKYTCTGSIINKDLVLTSAVCFQHLINSHNKSDNTDFNIDKLTLFDEIFLRAGIIKGSAFNATGFQERRGKGLMIHPDYRNQSTMFDVDVAIIKLATPWNLALDPTQVGVVPLWGQRIKELDWLKCYVVGFGYPTFKDYEDDMYLEDYPEIVKGNHLRYYRSQVGRERYCKFLRKNLGVVGGVKGEVFDDFYACAFPLNTTQGPCYGDIGAPLVCNGIVTGIMSQTRSKKPCEKDKEKTGFAVFTSVGADEVIGFLRRYIPDFPELVEVPPGDPFD